MRCTKIDKEKPKFPCLMVHELGDVFFVLNVEDDMLTGILLIKNDESQNQASKDIVTCRNKGFSLYSGSIVLENDANS